MADRDGPTQPLRLTGLFAPAPWLRDLGTSAWLGVGAALMVVVVIWLLATTQTIVMPVITASIVAAVLSPLVGWLATHRLSRVVASIFVLLAIVGVTVAAIIAILNGIGSQSDAIKTVLGSAKQSLINSLHDLGVSPDAARNAVKDASSAIDQAVPALLHGVGGALESLSSLVVFLSLTALSLFFLLSDASVIRRWVESHMRLDPAVAHQMTQRGLQSLRGYFLGVTLVAAFNAVVVTVGALILGVPQKGTIALITFLGAYVPYLGAWSAGAFSVLIALGGPGTEAAIGMIVVQLLANGILQQLVQPFAYGAALGIHPLAVLIVTIGGGALFGAVGLILAAPITSAITRIATDFAATRDAAARAGPEPAVAGSG